MDGMWRDGEMRRDGGAVGRGIACDGMDTWDDKTAGEAGWDWRTRRRGQRR